MRFGTWAQRWQPKPVPPLPKCRGVWDIPLPSRDDLSAPASSRDADIAAALSKMAEAAK